MKPKAPCLNCEERRPLCHAECTKYLYFRKALNEINELEAKQRLLKQNIIRVKKF